MENKDEMVLRILYNFKEFLEEAARKLQPMIALLEFTDPERGLTLRAPDSRALELLRDMQKELAKGEEIALSCYRDAIDAILEAPEFR